MIKTKCTILMLFLLFGTSVYAMTVENSIILDGSQTSNGQELKNPDKSQDATTNSNQNQALETAYKKLETNHKDPKNYSKRDH